MEEETKFYTRKDTVSVVALGNKRFFPYVKSQTITDDQTGITERTVIPTPPVLGNPPTITKTKGSLTETTNITYVPNGSWCNNKPGKVTVIKQLGNETQTRITSYRYDNKGNLIKETVDSTDVNKRETDYTNYTPFGQAETITVTANGKSRTSTFKYKSGRFLEKQTDVLGETVNYNWDESRGILSSKSDRTGVTSYQYDGMNRLVKTTYPNGVQETNTLHWAPNQNGRRLYYSQSQISGAAPVNTWYNAFGQEVLRETYGLNNKINVFTEYERYKKKISAPTTGSSTPSVWDVIYNYDNLGRISKKTFKQNMITDYEYNENNGKTTKVISPSETRKTTINNEGWVATVEVNEKPVTFTYYPSGLVKTSTPDGSGAVITEYDLQGNRILLIDPNAGTIRSKYNGFGDLLWTKQRIHKSGDSILTEYSYKNNGLLETVTRNNETTSYTYDSKNRLSSIEIAGQHKQTFTYDNFDRITNVEEKIGADPPYNTGTTYDSFGRVKRETFPSGYYTENHYNSYGILNKVTDSIRTIWEATAENEYRQLTGEKKGSKNVTYGYNNYGFPSSIVSPGIVNMTFDFNLDGNLNKRTDVIAGYNEEFLYDDKNRLVIWDILLNNGNGIPLKTYGISYDPSTGNILEKSDVGYSNMLYGGNGKPHALASLDMPSSSQTPEILETTYTDFNKIKTLTSGNKSYNVTYGVDMQRRKTVYQEGNSTLTRYYIGNYEKEVKSGGNTKEIHYLRGGGILIRNNGQENLLYGYTDYLGSLTALTDQNGTVLERYAYDPWGARRKPLNWAEHDTCKTWTINRGFTGHEHIDAFGIINMNGRVYDPLTAQFFSPDPYIQDGANWLNYNRYAYCMFNPLRYIDPTGEQWNEVMFHLLSANNKNRGRELSNEEVLLEEIVIYGKAPKGMQLSPSELAEKWKADFGWTSKNGGDLYFGKAQRIDAPVISEQTYKQAMKDYNKEQRAKLPSWERKFEHWLREKKVDKYDKQITDAMYPLVAGAVLWNPLVGVPNDIKSLFAGEDIYENEVNDFDRWISGASLATFGGARLAKEPVKQIFNNASWFFSGYSAIGVSKKREKK